MYNIISWNVNGYTLDIHAWLFNFTQQHKPDIIFLSETRKPNYELTELFQVFTDYHVIINSHNPARWHGVAMLIRKDHSYQELTVKMNIPVRKDNKTQEAATGRLILIQLDQKFNIIGSYTPNSGHSDPVKLNYRVTIWDPAFFNLLETLRQSGPTIWIGDINVVLTDQDVSHPKVMKTYAGFTPEERANFNAILSTGHWIDIWRHQNPTTRAYSWVGSPHRYNYGMRLDNIVISDSLVSQASTAYILTDTPQSADHLPVGLFVS
jgi:exodeoxyribonuclease-3